MTRITDGYGWKFSLGVNKVLVFTSVEISVGPETFYVP